MTENGFETIVRARLSGMGTRLAQAALAACIAWLLHPSIFPLIWLAAYVAAQGVDRYLFSKAQGQPEEQHQPRLLACIVANVVIFSSLSVYNWCLGGNEGKIFAAITICCSLVSVTLTMYYSKRYLYAAFFPHALYLMSLPVISLVSEPKVYDWPMAIVTISAITFLAYVGSAIRQLNTSMTALVEARDEADASRQAAEAANAAKSNFLAVITHEIRTPMNAVVSSLNFLRRTPLNDEQKAHVNMLESASDVLLGLLNDVLDLSRIEAGKMSFERAPVALRDLLSSLEALFSAQVREKGLTFRFSVAQGVPDVIMGDPLRIRQILFNLVSNAVKFTDHGSISLRVRSLEGSLSFEVEDQGIGIAEDNLERIFSSFEQAEAATTRRYGGTGLGLAISRRLARLMGGELNVRSRAGEGSCFYLTLPCEEAHAIEPTLPAITAAPEEAKSEAPLHVLIVDDHEVNRRIVSLFIQPLGWAWTMAENGHDAVRLSRAQTFDVILMDMQMPGMDGVTATRHIRAADGPNRMTPVVALTANALESHRQAWAEVGVHTVLTKPIDPDLLISALADHAAQGWQVGIEDVAVA